jgi:hypothetical protein
MHYAVHGHTAAEIIYNRANAAKDFMGLTTWTGMMQRTKNELTPVEIHFLEQFEREQKKLGDKK